MRQASSWTSADQVHRHIYVALGRWFKRFTTKRAKMWFLIIETSYSQLNSLTDLISKVHTLTTLTNDEWNFCELFVSSQQAIYPLNYWPLLDLVVVLRCNLWTYVTELVHEHALRWIPQNTFDDKSTFVQVMALVPSGNKPLPGPTVTMLPYGITRTKCVNYCLCFVCNGKFH